MRGEPASCAGDAGDGEVCGGIFLRGIHSGTCGARGVCKRRIHDGSVCKAEHERQVEQVMFPGLSLQSRKARAAWRLGRQRGKKEMNVYPCMN